MLVSRTPPLVLLFSKTPLPISGTTSPSRRILRSLSFAQFPTHVVPPSPPPRSLRHTVNNHGLNSRVPPNTSSHPRPPPHLTPCPPLSVLVLRPARPRSLRFPPFALPHHLPASRMLVSTERLSSAWRHTPMKWNPLPWFVGALLLVLIQYRRHRSEKEVYVDEDGYEVIKLKGPWQVGTARPPLFPISLSCMYSPLLRHHTLFCPWPCPSTSACCAHVLPLPPRTTIDHRALAAVSDIDLHAWGLLSGKLVIRPSLSLVDDFLHTVLTGSHPWRTPIAQSLSSLGLAQLVRATSLVPTNRPQNVRLPFWL
jgi:hypothetical protein